MKENLAVTMIQSELEWENPIANRAHFQQKIDQIDTKTDLIVLPEMFTTGFSMKAKELAEPHLGNTFLWMKEIAANYSAAICGSLIIEEDKKYFNRLYFVYPDGNYFYYDKKHLFTLAGEEKIYSPGKEKILVTLKGWKICPLICYDLRFPVWSRNTENYDFLIYVANWPEKRIGAWDLLLQARAIENMSYTLGVNRVHKDGKGFDYSGNSAIYNELGQQISTKDNKHREFVETVFLDAEKLQKSRAKLAFLNDRDSFQIE
ncbi:MAG: amidohydrolase [Bacteroidota bacterium]